MTASSYCYILFAAPEGVIREEDYRMSEYIDSVVVDCDISRLEVRSIRLLVLSRGYEFSFK